jgi:hypothetical protein
MERGYIVALGIAALAVASMADTTQHELSLDVTGLLDLETLEALTPETLEQRYSAGGFRQNPFVQWPDESRSEAIFTNRPFSNVKVDLTCLHGTLPLREARVKFEKKSAVGATWIVDEHAVKPENAERLKKALTAAFGGLSPSRSEERISGWQRELATDSVMWKTTDATARLEKGPGFITVSFGKGDAGLRPVPIMARAQQPDEGEPSLRFFLRLDPWLRGGRLWSLSQDALEAEIPVPNGLKSSPHFNWTTQTRDSARFARRIFNNTEQDILLFGDSVKAEEALLDFKDGKAAMLSVSILNRGDSGEVSGQLFQSLYKVAGREIGVLLGVAPKPFKPPGRGVTATEGWVWTSAHSIATLEYNADAMKGKVEFLRLRMAPLAQRNSILQLAAIGQSSGAKSRSNLLASVVRDSASGEVMITGVPMVDQGQKGYCVAASCQRVFNYMGISCDQHELAEIMGTTASGGTSLAEMYEALSWLDSRYGARFRAVKANRPFTRMTAKDFERYQKPDLMKVVKQYVDEGKPLLWALDLGRAPADPALPQQGGGHMRLIIGYNERTGDILFTDSWGVGHEKKSMPQRAADACTDAIFVMEPRR